MEEISPEKVDVIQWSEEPGIFIANALSPSKVVAVFVNENERTSRVVVPDNQLSLAIGKEGQNARLSAKLTGRKIDIKSETQALTDPPDPDMQEVDISSATGFTMSREAMREARKAARKAAKAAKKARKAAEIAARIAEEARLAEQSEQSEQTNVAPENPAVEQKDDSQ